MQKKNKQLKSPGKKIARGIALTLGFGWYGAMADDAINTIENNNATIEKRVTEDINKYESVILNAINKLRQSLNCPQFEEQEVRAYSEIVQKSTLHMVGWYKKHGPLTFISIPVVKDGFNPSDSSMYTQWVTEINAICNSMILKKFQESYGPKMRAYAKYNAATYCIDINLAAK